ncbi:MAG: S-ribosylhomocysteine lyase [Christensenellaceae bacterium]|jgi:S-ribosylhomocysteine lyase|nr:S-ribosylhomocysteine lyase [Christensenellaceae bacterium]
MEKIPSFQINHLRLRSGLYISKKYTFNGQPITTFDLRMKRPYHEPVMETGSVHAIEHIIATFLRNDTLWGNRIIYFGPMGCRTGFYLIIYGDLDQEQIQPLLERAFDYAAEFEGKIPGDSKIECGYCDDLNLELAKLDAAAYYNVLIDLKKINLNYPVARTKKLD